MREIAQSCVVEEKQTKAWFHMNLIHKYLQQQSERYQPMNLFLNYTLQTGLES
jgi:hypothetical protein